MNRILTALLLMAAFSVQAEIVRYKDTAGRTHYVDSVDKVPSEYRGQLENAKPLPQIGKVPARELPQGWRRGGRGPQAKAPSGQRGVLLVTSSCPYCRQAEAFLKENRIRFTKLDIERSSKGRKLYNKLGGGGVPIFQYGSEVVRGFSPEELLQAAGRR